MSRSLRIALLLAFAATACKDKGSSQSAADSALARDLTLASQAAVAQPSLTDVAESLSTPLAMPAEKLPPRPTPQRATPRTNPRTTPAPTNVVSAPTAQPQPAPVVAAAPSTGSIPGGTTFNVVTSMRICTKSNLAGDKLTAMVRGATQGTNGVTLPDGSTAVLEIASISRGETPEATSVTFRVKAISINGQSHTASGEATANEQLEKVEVAGQGGSDKKKVIGGAVAGAILGQVLGKDTKSTVIGAAAGAATGAVAAKVSKKYEGCLPAGSTVRVTLSDPLVLPIT
jgi:hypothetical protein